MTADNETPDPTEDPWCKCGKRESDHSPDGPHKFERSHSFNGGRIHLVKTGTGRMARYEWVPEP